jgi:hypothetical protein
MTCFRLIIVATAKDESGLNLRHCDDERQLRLARSREQISSFSFANFFLLIISITAERAGFSLVSLVCSRAPHPKTV